MADRTPGNYIEATQEAGRAFVTRQISGSVVEQSSVAAFLAFASDREYLSGIGHPTAALEDSRLLPLIAEHV
jgi:hypothetical protein